MKYEIVELAQDGDLVGYAVRKSGTLRLDSLAIYKPEEFDEIQAVVAKHNEAALIREHWPTPNDPEVQEILNRPDFEPVRYEDVEVPDLENSEIAYVQGVAPNEESYNNAIAHGSFSPEGYVIGTDGQPVIDYPNSTIVTKVEKQPVRVDGHSRLDAACEVVARERAGLNER